MNILESSIFIMQFPTILVYMPWIMTIMTHNTSRGFLISHRSISNPNQPPKIRKIPEKEDLARKMTTFPRKHCIGMELGPTIHKNTSRSRRNQGENHITLEKQGCRKLNALKITIVGIRQGRQVGRIVDDRRC